MKVDRGNLPLQAHQRYAVDQEIRKNNPITDLLQQVNTRPSTRSSSTLSTSHLSSLSLSKDNPLSWTIFCPPKDELGNFEYLFSPNHFSVLQRVVKRFFSFVAEEKSLKKNEEIALKELFTLIKNLQDMFFLIQSQRLGIQQG